MQRTDITELRYMTHVNNVPSILELGILSHTASAGLTHRSVASPGVQSRRAKRFIPGGLRLHQYANLYFNARNAMLFRVLRNYDEVQRVPATEITILRVAPSVFDIPGAVITDINAAADIAPRWYTVDDGLAVLDPAVVFAQSWYGDDAVKQAMMAEVLVPHRIDPAYIVSAYVVSDESAAAMSDLAPTLPTEVKPYMFFQKAPAVRFRLDPDTGTMVRVTEVEGGFK